MYAMFHGCKALESLDLSHFDTSLVEDMSCMFMKSNKLTSIEGLDKFDTSNATTMYQMFYECSHLQQVDLSHFNTSKVENMAFMFIDCSSLTSANISNFEFKEGCINNNMFQDCTSLNKLYVSSSAANLRTYDTGNDPFDSGSCVGVGTETTPCILICSDGFNPVPEEEDSDGKWMKWKSGYFIVSPMGDVNEDGRLSVADVMLTVNRLLVHPVSIFNEGNADMNNDGRLSVADVMLMVKAITGQH
jgi:surface protein